MIAQLLAVLLITSAISFGGVEVSKYSLELLGNGDALLKVSERIPLESEEEIEFWRTLQHNESLGENYENLLLEVLNETSEELGREMSISNFTVSFYLSPAPGKTYGVFEYFFLWKNFSIVSQNRMICGDVFIGGFWISENEVFELKIPEGFRLIEVSPPPDELRDGILIWYGPRDFQSGEPRVILEKENLNLTLLLLALLFSILALALLRMRAKREVASDEELVMELLKKHGGEIFQSEIVRLTGFSKSKVSMILSKLQKDGKIEKVMRGRENLIRLRRL